MTSKDIAEKRETPLALIDYGEDAGAGYENQTAADVAMQFIGVIQALSPQIDKSEAAFIEGAQAGDLFNTVTNQLIADGSEFIPAITEHVVVEWVPRDDGGGFVARHPMDDPMVVDARANQPFAKWKSPEGNDLVETFYVYGVLVQDAALIPAVIAFTKTKIKVYKGWNTRIRSFQIVLEDGRRQTPPLFAHRVKLGTIDDKNSKGKFKNFLLEPMLGTLDASRLEPTDERFVAAKKIRDMVRGGTAKVDYGQEHGAAGPAKDEDDPPF